VAQEYRVYGPPGCGKTTWIKNQIERAVKIYEPEDIIVTSFTKAAAVEVAGRDLPIPDENIGTLHALCYRALGRPTIAETRISEWNERASGDNRLTGGKIDLDEPATEAVFGSWGDEMLNAYNVLRARMIPRERWPETVLRWADEWEEWKAEGAYVDFGDMIRLGYEEMDEAPGNPKVIFADEVQDMNVLELALLRKWGERCQTFVLVGDEDQSIYKFRGVQSDAFLDPVLSAENQRTLSQSYRVPRAVYDVSQRWIRRVRRRQKKDYQPRDVDGNVTYGVGFRWRDPNDLIQAILADIEREKRIMLLASCSYMLKPTIKLLREQGIPFWNPYRRKRGDWNPLRYVNKGVSSCDRLMAFLRPDSDVWGPAARSWTYSDVRDFVKVLRSDCGLKRGAKKKLDDLPADHRHKEANLVWLLENVFEERAMDRAFELDVQWFEDSLLKSKRRVMEFPLRVYESQGGKGLTDAPKLIIGTIHSVKGGEADAVYLFPDLSKAGWGEWAETDPDAVVRQFYVGMTRAKETLTICQSSSGYCVPLEGEI